MDLTTFIFIAVTILVVGGLLWLAARWSASQKAEQARGDARHAQRLKQDRLMGILISVEDGSDEQRRAMDALLALDLLTNRDWVVVQNDAKLRSKPTLERLAIEVQLRFAEGRPRDDLISR